MSVVRIKRGMDIPVHGAVSNLEITEAPEASLAALLPGEAVGIKTKLLVREGDPVQVGTPLFLDRRDDEVAFTSPASGKVKVIHRGSRRAVLAVVVERNGNDSQADSVSAPPSGNDPAATRKALCGSGLWPALRQRPFGRIAHSGGSPAALFLTGTDSRPLAVSPRVFLDGREEDFQAGARALSSLLDGPTWLCIHPDDDWSGCVPEVVQVREFSGPHPAGLPGTHMHQLGPAGANQVLWNASAVDVADIGAYLLSGKIPVRRAVAVTGPAASNPGLVKTWLGADLGSIIESRTSEGAVRTVSGSLLDGRAANPGTPAGFLGRWNQQVSLVSEETRREMLAWMSPIGGRHTLTHTLLDKFFRRRFRYDTDLNGSHRAIIPIGSWEEVNPLDILPTALVKSLSAGDLEEAEKLGALELVEEDVALWEYVCPAKSPVTTWLRRTLDQIEKEG